VDSPDKTLAGATCRRLQSRPPLSPWVPTPPTNYVGTKAQEVPLWWHVDLRQDHKHTRSDEDQETMTPGGILAEEIHKTPGEIPAGDNHDATTRPLPGPR
jgi:hypothetical protein